MENETLETLDATGAEAAIELDSIAFERWNEERREAEQEDQETE